MNELNLYQCKTEDKIPNGKNIARAMLNPRFVLAIAKRLSLYVGSRTSSPISTSVEVGLITILAIWLVG